MRQESWIDFPVQYCQIIICVIAERATYTVRDGLCGVTRSPSTMSPSTPPVSSVGLVLVSEGFATSIIVSSF